MHTCKLNWEIAPTISTNYLFFSSAMKMRTFLSKMMDTDTKQVLLYFNTKHPHAEKKEKHEVRNIYSAESQVIL